MSPTRHPILRRDLVILAVYFLFALVLTYPLVMHLDAFGPGHGVDDPAQTWSIWWFKYATFDLGTSPLFTDYLFYPLGLNLVAYTPTFLNGALSIPLQFVFGVIVAQNLIVWFSLVAGGYGAYLFVREILSRRAVILSGATLAPPARAGENLTTGNETLRSAQGDTVNEPSHRTIAAALAGAVYAFGAWHINYVVAGHFMLLSNEWVPYFALGLIRWDKSSWRNGALAGLFFVMAAWTELTFAPFLAILTALYLLYQIILLRPLSFLRAKFKPIAPNSDKPKPDRKSSTKTTKRHESFLFPSLCSFVSCVDKESLPFVQTFHPIALNLVAMGMVSAVGISPLVLNLISDIQRYGYYLTSGVGRIQIFSAEPISFFFPSAQHPFLGAWANSITNANTSYAFIGYAVLVLAGLGLYAQRASPAARLYAVAALFFALVMLGPTLIVGGQSTGLPMPFAALRAIPFVNANRYPVRFNVMLMLMLAPLIAFGAAALLQTQRGTLRVALGALTALLAFEQLVLPIPLSDLRVPAVYQTIHDEPGDFSVLELPVGWRNSITLQGEMEDRAQFFQTVHQKRLLGGITSRTPQFKFQYFLEAPVLNSLIALEMDRELDDVRLAQDRAAAADVLRFFDIRYVDVDRALAGAAVEEYARDVFPMQEVYRDESRTVYRVRTPPPLTTINPADETARLYFDDSWGRAQLDAEGRGYRWATRGDSLIWLPLQPRAQTITFRLRGASEGQIVHVNANGNRVADLKPTTGWDNYAVSIPASIVRDGLNALVFGTETVPIAATRWSFAFPQDQDNYSIGDTGSASPVDIAATGAGYDAGRFGEIFVAGRNVVESKRGYQLVAVNPKTGAVDRVGSFDTFADANESTRLAHFIAQLPRGEIVAGVAIDDVSSNLKQEAIDAFRSIGVGDDLRFQFRMGHAFIGVKGAQPGQALEQVDGRFPANVSVGKDVASDRVACALGAIKIEAGGQ